MKFKIDRKKIAFDYEFLDGTTSKFEYFEPTTAMIDASTEIDKSDSKAQLKHVKDTLEGCLHGNNEDIEKLFLEQNEEGNLYDFKAALDAEVGKLKRKR